MKRKLSCLAILGLVGLLPSCVTEFEKPLVDPATAVLDQALVGNWIQKDPSGNVQMLFVGIEPERPIDPARETVEPGLAKYTLLTRGPDNKLYDPLTMRFITTQIGENHYCNMALPLDPKDTKKTTYWLYKYRVSADKLEVWHGDYETWAIVVESGKLKGNVVREGKNIKSITVTDTPENVTKFLAGGGDAMIFLERSHAEYQRVK